MEQYFKGGKKKFQCVAVVTYVLGLATIISSIGTSGPEYDGADSEVEGGS